MPSVNYTKRQKIIAQALDEIQFARTYKQGKVGNWKINEDLYYGRKAKSLESRANVDLGAMGSFVHTLLSKIDNPISFKFSKRKKSQLKRVNMLNSLKLADQNKDNWDIKDIVGKKQVAIYGRSIYNYYADSYKGYCPHLTPVDVYMFLVDPAGGGIDLEEANYLGDYGVRLNKKELTDGMKEGRFLKTETENLISGSGNSTDVTQEVQNTYNRTQDQQVWFSQKNIMNPDNYVFWRWYTTYEGNRYYLLMNERGGTAIRVEPLEEVFESGLWPYWTYAAFPDMTEFWTPSFCDYVREIFMSQAVSINQMLDNAEQINKPQKVVDVGAIKNLGELKYRREGIIKVKSGTDVNKALQAITTTSINTPIEVYKILDGIQEKASGVTAGSKGVSDEDKVGIYEGNQANAADRFGFLNKSYSFGYNRFAKLWEAGVREHLIKKVAIDILGPDGIDVIEVNRKDIFRKGDEFKVLVESSNAELMLSEVEKRTKIAFLNNNNQNPVQNPKKAYELQASIAGFDEETTRELLDTADFGDESVMSEAERDIERILDGERFEPNEIANTAYMQRFVNYMRDHKEDISQEQFISLAMYVELLEPIIIRNMNTRANQILMQEASNPALVPGAEPTGRTDAATDVPAIDTASPANTPLNY